MPLGDFFRHIVLDNDPQKDKKRKQTEKGRIASLVSRAAKKPKSQARPSSSDGAHTYALDMQRRFFTGRLHHVFAMSQSYEASRPDPKKTILRDRSRCAWSLLVRVAHTLDTILTAGSSNPGTRVGHIINTIVPDDTTTRLKGPHVGDKSVVSTIMNQVQACIVTYEQQGTDVKPNWHCFPIPCPTTIINVPDAENIHAAYASFLVCGANGLGTKLQSLGLPANLADAQTAKWAVQIMCGDALEANSSAFGLERKILFHKRKVLNQCHRKVAIRLKCMNHQLCLIRKPVVLGVERYWATLVRLAHLYECASFRRRIAAGVVNLLSKPGVFERH